MSGVWQKKDLLSLRELSAEEIGQVLSTASVFKEILGRPIKKVPALQGRTVVNLFIEPSTRTRISFELAAVRLSADVVSLDKETSSIRKGGDAAGYGEKFGSIAGWNDCDSASICWSSPLSGSAVESFGDQCGGRFP